MRKQAAWQAEGDCPAAALLGRAGTAGLLYADVSAVQADLASHPVSFWFLVSSLSLVQFLNPSLLNGPLLQDVFAGLI